MDILVKKWVVRARYDFDTAKDMFIAKRYLYVAFTLQQALEKILKAIIPKNAAAFFARRAVL